MKIIRERKKVIIYSLILLVALLIAYGFYNKLEATFYTYVDEDLPKEFDGYKIAFIADFHCKQEGKKENKLISMIDDFDPQVVVFTGDMIDGNHMELTPVKDLLMGLKGKYRMYATDGNHEKDNIDNYVELLRLYSESGVTYLNDTSDTIVIGDAAIKIYGKYYRGVYTEDFFKEPDRDGIKFNILLYHDATTFPAISSLGYDLILAGHTHGGIIRLPILGGLISTKLTLFAKYESGRYDENGSTMISSRGIGDAYFPRFNNKSELICLTLKSME